MTWAQCPWVPVTAQLIVNILHLGMEIAAFHSKKPEEMRIFTYHHIGIATRFLEISRIGDLQALY